jgi:hypothetical protein
MINAQKKGKSGRWTILASFCFNAKYLLGVNGIRHLFPALAVKDKSAKPSDKISMEILKITYPFYASTIIFKHFKAQANVLP